MALPYPVRQTRGHTPWESAGPGSIAPDASLGAVLSGQLTRPSKREGGPRHFNVTCKHTVSPPPPACGIGIEVWENGDWHAWKSYVHRRGEGTLFFVPGDLGGRVRMWGIYGDQESTAKTPWRYFEFRVTY